MFEPPHTCLEKDAEAMTLRKENPTVSRSSAFRCTNGHVTFEGKKAAGSFLPYVDLTHMVTEPEVWTLSVNCVDY